MICSDTKGACGQGCSRGGRQFGRAGKRGDMDGGGALFGVPGVELELQAEPEADVGVGERFGEADGHVGGEAVAAVQELGERLARNAQAGRRRGDGEVERLDIQVAEDFAGVGRVFHFHGFTASMVVNEIDVGGILAFKGEGNAVIGGDGNREQAFEVALQGMEVQPRPVHQGRCMGDVQLREDKPNPARMLWCDAAGVAGDEEALKPLVPKTLIFGPHGHVAA